jgi:NAD(P)-dependent dehydrogenase (short-subunit alcohol dehydrogenase family)
VVTGGTSGIGEETAVGLARRGARVVIVGRDRERGEASVANVRARSGNDAVDLLLADLSSQKEVRGLAAQILDDYPALHVLVNNAGVVHLARRTTVDGLESTFAVNHLAYFLLTRLLQQRLVASAPARIVNVASEGHRFARLDFDDLQSERNYSVMRVYGLSKLANILFTAELARRLDGSGVTANCLHPGAVSTRLGINNGWLGRLLIPALRPFFLTPEKGARTSIHLATSEAVKDVSGKYFMKCALRRPSAICSDTEAARRLWDVSSELTGLEP